MTADRAAPEGRYVGARARRPGFAPMSGQPGGVRATIGDMRRLGVLAWIALVCMAAPGSGLAAGGSPSRPQAPRLTVSLVTRAFAAHGIALEQKGRPWPANDTRLALRVFWNRAAASSQGVVTVQVLRSAAELRTLPSRVVKPSDCAGFPTSYLTVKARNVVATDTECFTVSSPIHVATRPALGGFLGAMQRLR